MDRGRPQRPGPELRMELGGDEVRVAFQFEDFHPPSPVRSADVSKARIFEFRDVHRVDFVPMPVSLENRRGPVQFCGLRVWIHVDLVGPEAHRRALSLHAPLLREQIDDGMRRLRIELRAVRALQAEVVARETNRRELEAQAHPLEWDVVLGGVSYRGDFPLDPAIPEPAGHEDSVGPLEELRPVLLKVDGLDPLQVHVDAGRRTRMVERLDVTHVRILEVRVLADECDGDLFLRILQVLQEPLPFLQVLSFRVEPERPHGVFREALAVEEQRDVVDRGGVGGADDPLDGHIAEKRDLLLDLGLQRVLAAGDNHAGLNSHRPKFADALLGRLRLLFSHGAHDRYQGRVHEQDVLLADLLTELPDRLEERHALDVADRPADFHEDDVRLLFLSDRSELRLNLVRDVRDDLDRTPEVVSAALLLNHSAVDLAGRDVVVPGQVHVEEPLVVPEVEVHLGAVVEDEHLPVLVRVHRARVDVQVRVDLDRADFQAFRFQQDSDGRGADSLSESRQNATRDNDILHVNSRDCSIRRVYDKVCVSKAANQSLQGHDGFATNPAWGESL